jgi:hypothetical protein
VRGQAVLEARSYRGPLRGDDRVDDSVAEAAVGHPLMAAQDAVLLGAQALDRRPGLPVVPVGAELDGDAVQGVEGVPEQQQFRLGVGAAALGRPGVPGRTDLHPPVRGVHVHVGGHPDHLSGVGPAGGERQHRAGGLLRQPAVDLRAHAVRSRDGGVPELPEPAVARRGHQLVVMLRRERLEDDEVAGQPDGLQEGHVRTLTSGIGVIRISPGRRPGSSRGSCRSDRAAPCRRPDPNGGRRAPRR